MSERRSTEIKFRTTPSFKARVQAAAAAADKSMSEFLEECAEARMRADVPSPNVPAPFRPYWVNATPQPEDDVDTSGDQGSSVKEQPLSWMFEARK